MKTSQGNCTIFHHSGKCFLRRALQYRSWVSVSIKKGRTAIPKPKETADLNYLASTCECSHLLDSLKGKEEFDPVHHTANIKEVREEMKNKKLAASDDVLRKVESGMDENGVRRLNYLKEKVTGT